MLIDQRLARVIEEAEKRYEADAPQRKEIERRIRERRPLGEIDELNRIQLRKARLLAKGVALSEEVVFERTIGGSDLMPVNYLEQGLRVARAVGRIVLRDRRGHPQGFGTGFIVSPRLLLTNNHVFETVEDTVESVIEFNYQYSLDGPTLSPVAFRFDPDQFFVTDRALDYSLVAISHRSTDGTALSEFGWIPLFEEEGKIALSEYVSIIQHPKGGPKQLAIRENQLVARLENFLHYLTDTEPGSSGSPVFNDQWEVVALHHSGVPKRDAQGNILAWVANEGVRISRIIHNLKGRRLSGHQAGLLDQMVRAEAEPKPELRAPLLAAHVPGEAFWQARLRADGSAVWFIPLEVSVRIGPSPVALRPTALVAEKPSGAEAAQLRAALDELNEARRAPYYPKEKDEKDSREYYKGIPEGLSRAAFFQSLSALLEKTHMTRPKYQFGKQLYSGIDLQPNGKLRSIYSHLEFEPEAMIEEAFRLEQELATQAREMFRKEAAPSGEELERLMEELEAKQPFNCEHAVPQSWFNKKEPMRGDLHHLFTCESDCNSFRGNTPYFDFPGTFEVLRDDCGRREKNAAQGKSGFEPPNGKGEVARAMLYFLLRYPGLINRSTEFDEERLQIILRWHKQHQVTRHEKHRNMAIFKLEGNRNPLIDHPEWADRIDFTFGLGT